MDNKKFASELLRIAEMLMDDESVKTSAKKDPEKLGKVLLDAIKDADEAWISYQDYLTRASKPFKEMMQKREAMMDATTPLYNFRNDPKIKGNLKLAEEIRETIDSFEDPSKFQ